MVNKIDISKSLPSSFQQKSKEPSKSQIDFFNAILNNYDINEEYKSLNFNVNNSISNKKQTEYIKDLGFIPSYLGEFPSPLPLMWYAPTQKELENTITNKNFKIPASTIRGWVKDASTYHNIPQELLAALLQNENPIRQEGVAGFLHNAGQYFERSGTTFLQIIDDKAWNIIPDKIGDTRIASGSSGIGNLTRDNLRVAVQYTKDMYNKEIIPADVRFRESGYDSDTRISGDDLKSDLYYTAAYVRRLIDIIKEEDHQHDGLTIEQAEKVLTLYNGPLDRESAKDYGKRGMNHIFNAQKGISYLYFYEQ